MLILLLMVLIGVFVGAAGNELVRRHGMRAGNPVLADLRETLAEMERDYRLRVATAEFEEDIRPLDRS